MRKILLIGLKDLILVLRDRAALIFMLLAPFLLTLGLACRNRGVWQQFQWHQPDEGDHCQPGWRSIGSGTCGPFPVC